MGKFVASDNPIRLCEGTCGRMTRSSKVLKATAPDTVVRHNLTHCQACWLAIPENQPDPVDTAAREARAAVVQAERVAAAHKVRETVERQRQERQEAAGRKHLARQIAAQRGLISA